MIFGKRTLERDRIESGFRQRHPRDLIRSSPETRTQAVNGWGQQEYPSRRVVASARPRNLALNLDCNAAVSNLCVVSWSLVTPRCDSLAKQVARDHPSREFN